ncbi:MAG: sigma-70 family RNA polymerase sigma factor [Myxococcales bacterium]|nr:sigma-70 family RNA polymerase sigma factor [Myxococcales bacterium]
MSGRVISFIDRFRRSESSDDPDRPDAPLIERFQKGDRDAFSVLYARHYERVLRVVWRMVGGRAEAEDITQDVFIRVFHALPNFETRARFSTWLYRIAVNASLDYLKSGRRRFEKAADEDGFERVRGDTADPLTSLDAARRRALVSEAVSRLPEKYRVVIVLRDIEERPYEEIREITGLPVTTLKMRAIRGREMLARLVRRMVEP